MTLARKLLAVFLIQCIFVIPALASEQRGTADEAKALSNKALAEIKAAGPDKAFEAFSAKDGKWQDRDLYVFVIKFDGTMVAHGANKGLIGKNQTELKDASGQSFVKAMMETVKTKGSGWIDYMWSNPQTKKLEAKSSFVQRIPNFEGFVGVGIYKP